MHWILQENIFKEDAYEVLIDTLERFGISHSLHKVVPFVGELIPIPDLRNKNAICFGSYAMRHYAKKEGLVPGVFDIENMDFTIQLKNWGDEMLNHDALVTEFKNVKFDELAFIRPIHDSKVFAGKVFEWQEFSEWQRKVCELNEDYGDSLTPDTLVQVCRPKKILSEHRFWIVKGEIITASTYKLGDKVIYRSDVDHIFHEYVKRQIDTWQPHECFVIDVADTVDGIKIVEINTLNSSGFYAADVQKLVFALESKFTN